jgi:hypothetical protein
VEQRVALHDCFAALTPPINLPAEPRLDEAEIHSLIEFFTLLDTWERKSHATQSL